MTRLLNLASRLLCVQSFAMPQTTHRVHATVADKELSEFGCIANVVAFKVDEECMIVKLLGRQRCKWLKVLRSETG